MASLDITAMSAAMKEYYTGKKMLDLSYKKNPWLAMVPKFTKFGGKTLPIPVKYGNSQGRSAVMATAQANQTAAELAEFQLTRKRDYSVATIANEVIEATAGDAMAFLKGTELCIESAISAVVNSLASAIFRSGTGTIGKITSISTGVIVLTNAADALQFEKGMSLKASTGDGSGLRAAVGYVVALDRSAGVVTVSATPGGVPGSPAAWAATDYLSVEGDYNAKISGLLAWLPTSAPGSTPFYGVDRSTDTDRLGGVRYDAGGLSIEEGLIIGASMCSERGGTPTKVLMSGASFRSLVTGLGSKVQYVDTASAAGIGFRGVRINGDQGPLDVIADRNCPPLLAFVLDMDTWCLNSLNEAPHILTYGKNADEMIRVSNEDSAEVRVAAYANLGCSAPGWNAVVSLSA